MVESLPRQLLAPMPSIWLKPVITAEYNPTFVYNCPLYKVGEEEKEKEKDEVV